MAKKKNGFDTTALKKYADQLESAGTVSAIKRAVEGGALATKNEVNAEVTAAMQSGNLPAGGKYSTGETMKHLDKEMHVEWAGNTATLKLGFHLEGTGLTSIFLMYGTPKMAPASGLREALKEHPRKISRKKMQEVCVKILERLGK